jgi:hypothetical protein
VKRWLSLILLVALPILISGCKGSDSSTVKHELPDYVHKAPHNTQIAYQYAVEHPDMLTHQPCYCGCVVMDHKSNLDCYIQEIDASGQITFDLHASGCGICVDITLDVMRLADEGKSQLEIRQYIDATYSQYGPSTETTMPEA